MNKKLLLLLAAFAFSVSSFAQFEKGKVYASTGLTGASLNYSSGERWKADIGAKLGYMLERNWMGLVQAEYNYRKYESKTLNLGMAVRYYFEENGVYIGAGFNYAHCKPFEGESKGEFFPGVHLGYAFFLSRTVTFEPELYYNQSFKDHDHNSNMGFRFNFGIYLDDLF